MALQTPWIVFLCIFEVITGALAAEDGYVGCYKDEGDTKAFRGYVETLNDLTTNKCVTFCFGKGFLYAATQGRTCCLCGDRQPTPTSQAGRDRCSRPCVGDPADQCGDETSLSVWQTRISDLPETGNYIGCFDDHSRLLNNHAVNLDFTNSPRRCMNLCLQLGYKYSGVQYGRGCHCGNIDPDRRYMRGGGECNWPCTGDRLESCGGNWRIAVYSTNVGSGSQTSTDVGKFLGCYKDLANPGKPSYVEALNDLTTQKCTNLCYSKGFLYSWTQDSNSCFCGDKHPNPNSKISDDQCSQPCAGNPAGKCGGVSAISVRETGIPDFPEVANYIGCFDDHSRLLNDHAVNLPFTNSPRRCMNLCLQLGYKYSGVQYGQGCHCGNYKPETRYSQRGDDCSWPCSGADVTDIVCLLGRQGCHCGNYKPETRYSQRGDDCSWPCSGADVTDIVCLLGRQGCHCGNYKPETRYSQRGDDCSWPCSGDPLESCGGDWRMAIYSTGAPESAASAALPLDTGGNSCGRSDTTVNGKVACSGQVVFEDSFSDTLGKWRHVVMIPDAPDYEFNVFHSDKVNSFTRDGKLVIKPTVYDDVHVLTGTVDLDGCTAPQGSRQCGFTAFSNRILPPVASARINTRDSFSFRYGIIEIRAKMPRGDWLVPELWLEPKDHFYGPEYASGRLRVAMSRGNTDLKCSNEDFGQRQLESAVLMGSGNNVRKRSVRLKLPENWHDRYHNYTVVWTPGSISFKVDNEKAREIAPPGKKLCEAHDFASEECLAWSSGTSMAPLDKDFVISLGLSVGNVRDFPDGCVNRGKQKPWKNHELKALLNFWRDRESWRATWSDEGSSLYVDHVRVTAL